MKKNGGNKSEITKDRYIKLLDDEKFRDSITNRTTNVENIKTRIERAALILYGVEIVYE